MEWYKTSIGSCKYPGENCPGRGPRSNGIKHGFFCWIEPDVSGSGWDSEVVEDIDPKALEEMKEKL